MKRLLEIRRRLLLVGALASMATAVLLAAPTAGAGGQAGWSCPTGFDLGGLTYDQALALERIQAGINAGVHTQDDFKSFFAGVDRNHDGVVCVKTNPAGNGLPEHWYYAYNFVDDNASVPNG
jgi:hypothetical protein